MTSAFTERQAIKSLRERSLPRDACYNRLEIAPVCTGLQECAGVWLSLGAWRLLPACRPRLSVTGITGYLPSTSRSMSTVTPSRSSHLNCLWCDAFVTKMWRDLFGRIDILSLKSSWTYVPVGTHSPIRVLGKVWYQLTLVSHVAVDSAGNAFSVTWAQLHGNSTSSPSSVVMVLLHETGLSGSCAPSRIITAKMSIRRPWRV